MSWFKKLVVEERHAKESSLPDRIDRLSRYVPESFSLKDLAEGAREPLAEAYSKKHKTRTGKGELISLLTCLRCEQRIAPTTPADQDAVKELVRDVAKIIAPVATQDVDQDQSNENNEEQDQSQIKTLLSGQCMSLSGLGMEIIEGFMERVEPVQLDDEVLFAFLVYSDENKNWGSQKTKETARQLLEQQFNLPGGHTKEQFLIETLLQSYLRALFSKSKPSSITASGRKAEYADSDNRGESLPDDSARTKPWKYTDLRALPALAWAIREADTQLIAKHWPLFIPVLLTLVDDSASIIRHHGLFYLTKFLAKFPDKTLHDTGLAQVFEDAIFPTLAFLPSLTPENESVLLLHTAYPALLRLADKRPTLGKDGVPGAPKNDLLDKMLREGVLMGYFHAKEHVKIVGVLCEQTAAIVCEMGVHAVKHLKDLIPKLSSIMTDPFAPVAPATLLAAIKALQAVLANCWPRIPGSPWQDQIINALVLCWLHVVEHEHPATDKTYTQIEQELLTSSKALAAVLKSATGDDKAPATSLSTHVAPLVAKDPRLATLFPSSD